MSLYQRIVADDQVLLSLAPTAQFGLTGAHIEFVTEVVDGVLTTTTPNLQWFDPSVTKPTKEEILAERARLQAELDSTEYQRLRQPEYPPLADLADAIYWQAEGDESKMTAYLAAVDAVKQKYPKEGE
jgi:hypothetical protein